MTQTLLDMRDLDRITHVRRDLHAHPELSLEEERTSGIVAGLLREFGLDVAERIGGFGVVGTLRGRGEGPPIAFRADMDALAIQEESGFPHASTRTGVMHACGHDGHTAMLLGAALALSRRGPPARDIRFVFQPAEEQYGGARRMIADGLFDRFPARAIYGLHNAPGLPVGCFATRPGAMMAAAAAFRLMLTGAGGHAGSAPHRASDLTLAQAEFVMGLQTVVRRSFSPLEPIVLTVGHVGGGRFDAPNIMPSVLTLSGTARCFDWDLAQILSRRIEDLAQSVARTHGCAVTVEVDWEARPLVNSAPETARAIAAAEAVADHTEVRADQPLTTGGEDFADFLDHVPGAYMLLGNAGPAEASRSPLHTSRYDFNDASIPLGVAYWCSLADLPD